MKYYENIEAIPFFFKKKSDFTFFLVFSVPGSGVPKTLKNIKTANSEIPNLNESGRLWRFSNNKAY